MIKKVIFILTACAASVLVFMNCDVLRLVGREEYLGINKNGNDITYSITVNPGSGDNFLKDIAADRNFIYLAGSDTEISSYDSQMRLEKRYKSTGELVKSFGKNGVIQYNFSSNNFSLEREMISKISIDDEFIYLGCIVYRESNTSFSGNPAWIIQKRYKNTGEIVESFGKNGSLKPDIHTINNSLNALITDDIYIYIAGESIPLDPFALEQSGSAGWHLEKRYKIDGALVKSFGSDGIYQFDYSKYPDTICDIKIDNNFIYAAGFDNYNQEINTNDDVYIGNRYTLINPDNNNYDDINQTTYNYQWRIEKINKDTGELEPAFGTDGVIRQKLGSAGDICEKIAIDDNYLYLAGIITSGGATSNYIRIEKRYITNGALVDTFGNNGIINKYFTDKTKTIGSITLSNENFFLAEYNGYITSPMEPGTIIEKRNSFRGTLIREFAEDGIIQGNNNSDMRICEKIIADGKFIYLACNDTTSGKSQWRLEKRFEETGKF